MKHRHRDVTPREARVDKILEEIGLPAESVSMDVLEDVEMSTHTAATCHRGPCGKMNYPSESMAKTHIRRLINSGKSNTSHLLAYFCAECSAWHMSSRKA